MVLKWHQEFCLFLAEHFNVLKLGIWWDLFVKSRKCMSLKLTEEFSVMSKKNDAKFLKGFDLSFPNWHDKFEEFWRLHSKVSKICILTGSFWRKYIMLELKRYRGVIFHDTEEWWKIWRKTDLRFGKWHQEFANFLHSTRKFQNWDFGGIPL